MLDHSLKSYLDQNSIQPQNSQPLVSSTINKDIINKDTINQAEMNTDEYYKLNDQVSYHIAQGSFSSQDFLSISQDMVSASPQVRQRLMTRLAKELNKH